MWGFARAILDVLNKHFQTSLHISITQSSLIQVITFLAYFLMAIPAGLFVLRKGYKRGVMSGLCLYAIGAFLFVPSSILGEFYSYLVALFVVACGLAFLEVSANPYVVQLGKKETSSSRLNFAQSFNGLGSILAPVLIGNFLFSQQDGDVKVPYVLMGTFVVVVAIVFSRMELPEVADASSASYDAGVRSSLSVLRNKSFRRGLLALLAYEVSEISINSYFINFTTGKGWLSDIDACKLLSIALFLFMMGRFAGSWLMRKWHPQTILMICALGSALCMLVVLLDLGTVSIWALMMNYAFESIMFPTIYSMSLQSLSASEVKSAGSVLMMTPVGGCAFLLMGLMADQTTLVLPFCLPLLGFVVIVEYVLWLRRKCH